MNVHKIGGLGSDATGTTQMVDIGGRRLALTMRGSRPNHRGARDRPWRGKL